TGSRRPCPGRLPPCRPAGACPGGEPGGPLLQPGCGRPGTPGPDRRPAPSPASPGAQPRPSRSPPAPRPAATWTLTAVSPLLRSFPGKNRRIRAGSVEAVPLPVIEGRPPQVKAGLTGTRLREEPAHVLPCFAVVRTGRIQTDQHFPGQG